MSGAACWPASLESLTLGDCELGITSSLIRHLIPSNGHGGVGNTAPLATLTTLRLFDCDILGCSAARTLAELLPPNLKDLTLSNAGLHGDSLAALLAAIPSSVTLWSLDLSRNDLRCLERVLLNLPGQAPCFVIAGPTEDGDAADVVASAHLVDGDAWPLPRTLRNLDLTGCTLGPRATRGLAAGLPPHLRELVMKNCLITEQAHVVTAPVTEAQSALFLALPPTLLVLDLSGETWTASAMTALMASLQHYHHHHHQQLKVLRLAGSSLPPGATAVVVAHLPPALRMLDLQGFVFTAQHAQVLAAWRVVRGAAAALNLQLDVSQRTAPVSAALAAAHPPVVIG
ncbi:hypothetical protein H9P43_009512 [Blastocladiella emersonii ATCC 22665]|nr:hypothetical protein H9P43_009512 [Blastocladiella emersonii ATCC 22665]